MELIDFPPETRAVEWPTAALAALIYGLWLAATYWHRDLPLWALPIVGGWTVAWHMSLQHEVIHGHPTKLRWLNNFIGVWPLALWLPYEVYRRTHLQHHNDARLTDPLEDPESNYWTPAQWDELGGLWTRVRASAIHIARPRRHRPGLGDDSVLVERGELARSGRSQAAGHDRPPRPRGRGRAGLGPGRLRHGFLDLFLLFRLCRNGPRAGALLRRASRGKRGRAAHGDRRILAGSSGRCSCSTIFMSHITCALRCRGTGCPNGIGLIARR